MSNPIVYDGKTLSQWARELGVARVTIRKRIATRGSIEAALGMGPNNRPSVKHGGKTAANWARQLGITRQAMQQRIARFGSLEAAVGRGGPRQMRKKPKKYKCKHTHIGKSCADWALELGISMVALYHRIARLGSLEAAVALGGRNKPGRKAKEEGR